ncbi:MAG: mechanosensitive ion channel domain-containing protein [Sphingomonadaceae bacterium]
MIGAAHGRKAGWCNLVAIFLAVLCITAPAAAQESAPSAESIEATSPIEAGGGADPEIRDRIRSIFGQIDALRGAEVAVSSGVVRLSGAVPSAEDIRRAEAIAARVSGVVTVENSLTRDLAVDSNLSPALGNLGDDLRGVVQALPLLGIALAIAVLIAVIGYMIAALDRLWRWVTPNVFLAELVASSIRFVFIILGLVIAMEILGATALLGAVLGGAGVVGIALGFAVRDTVDNYVSSLMLSLRQPFRANDHVVIESNEGRVVRLTSRATILMTLDGNHLRIPNATVFKAVILNYTRNPERRFEFDLGIDAEDDPIEGMAVGLAAVNALEFVLNTPKADAVILDVGDSNIVLRFFGWVDQTRTDFMKGRSLAIQAAKSALEEAGFALPEPIYRLRFDEAVPPALESLKSEPRVRAKTEAKIPPTGTAQDTAPDEHVVRLVKDERANDPSTDLLDERRPIE